MERLFTVIYAFMASELGLKGLAKEVFAIIFGFWIKANRSEVLVPLRVMQKITGCTKTGIQKAVHSLEKMGVLQICRTPGKKLKYMVTIGADVIRDFEEAYMVNSVGGDDSSPVNKVDHPPVNRVNQQRITKFTSSGQLCYPQKKEEKKINKNLMVKSKKEINTGGLPEA